MDNHNIVHARSQGLIDFAYRYAQGAHGTQVRKYTGEPYINHPVAVAQLVASVTDDCEMICAALLHDVLEDTPRTYDDLIGIGFGTGIADLVVWLSDVSKPENGNRKQRKALDRQHIARAPHRAKTVKLADLIHNTESITQYDPGFAQVYMAEKKLLLPVLTEGDQTLHAHATKLVRDYYKGLQ